MEAVAALWETMTGVIRRAWSADWVRGPVLLFYYLGLIYVLVRMYGGGHYTPPPFVYQGF